MAFLKSFRREQKTLRPELLPAGCFSVHREGGLVASTLPSSFSQELVLEIGHVVLEAFHRAAAAHIPLNELYIHFSGLTITAKELRGGALIFLIPATLNLARPYSSPTMHYKNIEEFILHLETYIECWKQFNTFVNLARDKKFSREDENQFLEVKSILTQGLEAILFSAEKQGPRKDDVASLFSKSPSLRYLSDMPDAVHDVEAQWHKIYLSLQSLLGQLKVQLGQTGKEAGWSLFGSKK